MTPKRGRTTDPLFANGVRTDHSPSKAAEDTFSFLDRSARQDVEEVTRLLNEWFAEYPATDRDVLRRLLQDNFPAGFFELFLHAYFRSDGFTLEPHPSVPGSDKKPDFLVRKGSCEFYLEAKVIYDRSDQEAAQDRVKNLLIDAINSVNSPNFFLRLMDFVIEPGKQPAGRKVKAFLERKLPNYDPDKVAASLDTNDSTLEFEDDTIRLRVALIPKSPEARGKKNIRPIGVYPIETSWLRGDSVLRQAVAEKATRYGRPDRPFIICVNYVGKWGIDQEDILNALFGRLHYTVSLSQSVPQESRKANGIFKGPNGPHNKRVSGVVVSEIWPWNLHTARFELYHHPNATQPLSACKIPIRQARVVQDRLEWSEGINLGEMFKLHPDWPNVPE